MRMKQPTPISVRPRKGSDLEKLWIAEDRKPAAMREYFHSWAEQFNLSKHEGGERDEGS